MCEAVIDSPSDSPEVRLRLPDYRNLASLARAAYLVGDAYLISMGHFALRISKLRRVVGLAQVGWRFEFRMHAPASLFLLLALPSPCRDET